MSQCIRIEAKWGWVKKQILGLFLKWDRFLHLHISPISNTLTNKTRLIISTPNLFSPDFENFHVDINQKWSVRPQWTEKWIMVKCWWLPNQTHPWFIIFLLMFQPFTNYRTLQPAIVRLGKKKHKSRGWKQVLFEIWSDAGGGKWWIDRWDGHLVLWGFCFFVFCLLKTDNSWAAAYYYLIIIILTTGYSVDYSIGESSNRICSQWFPF